MAATKQFIDMHLDVSKVEFAMHVAEKLGKVSMSKTAMESATEMIERQAKKTLYEFMNARAVSQPERFWHMYKANRIGVPGSELFRAGSLAGAASRGKGSRTFFVQFLRNGETLRNDRPGLERDGVWLPNETKEVGTRMGRRLEKKKTIRPDTRNPSRSYRWPMQASTVEYGRRVTIDLRKKRGGPKMLAVMTTRGIVLGRRRVIQYKNWPTFLAFTIAYREWSESFRLLTHRNFRKAMDRRVEAIEHMLAVELRPQFRDLMRMTEGQRASTRAGFRIQHAPKGQPAKVEKELKRIWRYNQIGEDS